MPGEQPTAPGWIKLNTNECPYPPSPRALARIGEAVNEQLRLYPDPQGGALRQCLADRFALSPAHVFLGNGSDEVLAHVFRALLKHERPVLFPDVTYSFYPVYCGLFDIASEAIPLAPDFAVDLSGYARTNGGIVLANPNANPDGSLTAYRFDNAREDNILSADAGIRWEIDTGPVATAQSIASICHHSFGRGASNRIHDDLGRL